MNTARRLVGDAGSGGRYNHTCRAPTFEPARHRVPDRERSPFVVALARGVSDCPSCLRPPPEEQARGRSLRACGRAAARRTLPRVVAIDAGCRGRDRAVRRRVHQRNDNGAIAIFGNNLLTCPASTACAGHPQRHPTTGANTNNNNYDMVNLDAGRRGVPDVQLVELAGDPAAGVERAVRRPVLGRPHDGWTERRRRPPTRSGRCRCARPRDPSTYRTITTQRTFGPTATADRPTSSSPTSPRSCRARAPASTGAPTWRPAPDRIATPAGRSSSSTATRRSRCAT